MGLDWAVVEPLADDELERQAGRARGEATQTRRVEPDYAAMHRNLYRNGVTPELLWEEYVEAHPGQRTYPYTPFCQRYKDRAQTLKRSMRQQHRKHPVKAPRIVSCRQLSRGRRPVMRK